jgi:hemoglobin-like flavoprotein
MSWTAGKKFGVSRITRRSPELSSFNGALYFDYIDQLTPATLFHTQSTHPVLLFLFRWYSLFEKCPKAKVLFGFPLDIDTHSPELLESKRFIMHAAYLIQMLDMALNMLGPDIELLTEIMTELGIKHVRYGVKPEMFPIMGEALIYTLQTILKSGFTERINEAWIEIYSALSQDMIRVQLKTRIEGTQE